jgi:ATP:corrinoid adenosyltransferase
MTEDAERHNEKMRKHKVARDKIMATKTIEKGLLLVHTGKGKGKTTAAMGMVCRAIGHGHRVAIIQFIKGAMFTGEKVVFDAFPEQVTMRAMGEVFTWETQDRARYRSGAPCLGYREDLHRRPVVQDGALRRTEHRLALRLLAHRRSCGCVE